MRFYLIITPTNCWLKQYPFLPISTNTTFTFKARICFSFRSETAFVSGVYQVAQLQPVFYLFKIFFVYALDSKHFPNFDTFWQLSKNEANCGILWKSNIQLQ